MNAWYVDRNHMIFFVSEHNEEEAAEEIFNQLILDEELRQNYGIQEFE